VPPVTLKSEALVLTVQWVQLLLLMFLLGVVLIALLAAVWVLGLIPLIIWKYHQNRAVLIRHQTQNLLLNAENQWFLVDSNSQNIAEAQLSHYWQMPAFIAISLASKTGHYWYIILRRNFTAITFSRVVMGLHKDKNETK
jgi:uncharacterized membrane protein